MSESDQLSQTNRRLAEIQAALWDLDRNDFKARHELLTEQDRLRRQVRESIDVDSDRPTEELMAELEARRKALQKIQESMVGSAGMSGGGGAGAGSFEGPADGVRLNTEIVGASGAVKLQERIYRLETILTERGVL